MEPICNDIEVVAKCERSLNLAHNPKRIARCKPLYRYKPVESFCSMEFCRLHVLREPLALHLRHPPNHRPTSVSAAIDA